MKNFNVKESYTDFPILPFSTIYSFDDPKDQLAMVNTLILDSINRYAPLKRTKFTRPPAPWMKKLVIMALQKNATNETKHSRMDQVKFMEDSL